MTNLLFANLSPSIGLVGASADNIYKGKKLLPRSYGRGIRKNVRETALQTPRSVKENSKKAFQVLEQRFCCCPQREQVVPQQPMEEHTRAAPPGAGGCALTKAVACGEPTEEQEVQPMAAHDGAVHSWSAPTERIHAGTVFEELQLV